MEPKGRDRRLPRLALSCGHPSDFAKVGILAVVYVASARLGLSLGAVSGVATSVWPPTGISLAALVLFGDRLWPGVACGALLSNVLGGVPIFAALAIAAGNTLEAVCGARLLRRVGFQPALERLQDILALVGLAAVLSTTVSATIGATAAWLGGVFPAATYGVAWWTWWLGDAMGDVVIAPVLLVWGTRSRMKLPARRLAEYGALLVSLTIVSALVLGGSVRYPGPYAVFPFAVWAALRFGQPGVSVAILVASAAAIWGAEHAAGPHVLQWELLSAQTFMGVVSVTALMLGAVISERQRAEAALRRGEEHFRSLIENGLDLISVLDSAGILQYASPSNARVLGFVPDELIGKSAFDFVHPDDASRVLDVFAAAVRQPGPTPTIEFRFRHKDGSWRMIEAIGNTLFDDDGVATVVVNSRDVTDRYLAERERREEAEVSHALVRVGRTLISSLDTPPLLDRLCEVTADVLGCECSHTLLFRPKDDVFTTVSAYGYTPEQWEAIRVLTLPRAMLAGLLRPLEADDVVQMNVSDFRESPLGVRSMAAGFHAVLCMALRRGDHLIGFQVACHRTAARSFAAHQEQIGRGIAQLASMALENARLVEEVARASRLKSEFVATMSHELRTPLSVIMGYTDLMLDGVFGTLTPDQSRSLERVNRSSNELLELITATLDLSRLESGRVPLDIQSISVDRLMDEVKRETRELQERSGLSFVWNVEGKQPIETDRTKVKVVLKNLIGNAVKFTERGTVTVDARVRDDRLDICVTDTGVGVHPEHLPIIFEAFRQADSSSTRRYGGVGLGLYIVRQLVELLGGTVAVDSEVGRGSKFSVQLPATHATDSASGAIEQQQELFSRTAVSGS